MSPGVHLDFLRGEVQEGNYAHSEHASASRGIRRLAMTAVALRKNTSLSRLAPKDENDYRHPGEIVRHPSSPRSNPRAQGHADSAASAVSYRPCAQSSKVHVRGRPEAIPPTVQFVKSGGQASLW